MPRTEPHAGQTLFPIIGALIALSALFGLVVMPRLGAAGSDMVGEPAPDFALPVVANGDAGARIRLADLRGRVVILDFWASFCAPCAAQAPILDRLARKYPDRLIVLGINVGEPPEIAAGYAHSKGLSYPILADVEGDAQQLYRATSLPTVVLVDRQGKLVSLMQGITRQSSLEQALGRLW